MKEKERVLFIVEAEVRNFVRKEYKKWALMEKMS